MRKGIVTTRYPRRAEPAPDGFRGRVEVLDLRGARRGSPSLCPTGAIGVAEGRVALDRRQCILCGACVAADPERFAFAAGYETRGPAPRRPGRR